MSITKDEMIELIDAAADGARTRIVGDPVRVFEYQEAESDAKAFAANDYTGAVPLTIAVWAQAKQWTAKQATDDIINASNLWRSALIGLRQARLIGKESVRSAVTDDDALPYYETTISTIKAILSQVS